MMALEEQLIQFFARAPEGVDAAYLFGSFARGTASDASDVDVGLLYKDTPEGYLSQPYVLEADLSEQLGRRAQLVVLNTAPADLVHRVLRDGRLLLDREPRRRIAFEVRRRGEYFDLLPILREYRNRRPAS